MDSYLGLFWLTFKRSLLYYMYTALVAAAVLGFAHGGIIGKADMMPTCGCSGC